MLPSTPQESGSNSITQVFSIAHALPVLTTVFWLLVIVIKPSHITLLKTHGDPDGETKDTS